MPITLVSNIAVNRVATSTRTSNICEPSAAANGNDLMVTGNWFATTSNDNGATWVHVDPYTRFPATGAGFCCDQLVLHNPRHGIWIWLLQYSRDVNGTNIFRLAVCRDNSFGNWYYWDFAPKNLNQAWSNLWFDYPDMAVTDEKLFVTFNVFEGDSWRRAVLFRFPLAILRDRGPLSYNWWSTTQNGSIRLCRGPGATMYMGSHGPAASQIRVFEWPDTAANLSSTDVTVRPWTGRRGSYSAPGPGGVDWLMRLDPRITGAWVGNGQIGFMWSADRDAQHPHPFIRVARINAATKALINEPDIWSATSAWAYPTAGANARGEVGIAAFFGGGMRHPGHAVGAEVGTGWTTQLTRVSTHGPTTNTWGDYLSCVAHNAQGGHWVASGYTLQGGGDRANIEPRYVEFNHVSPPPSSTGVAAL